MKDAALGLMGRQKPRPEWGLCWDGGDIQHVSASSHLMVPNQQAENSPKG